MAVAFLETLATAGAIPRSVGPIFERWLRRLHGYSADLRKGVVPAPVWQREVGSLLEHVPLEELLRLIDFEQMVKSVSLPDDRATTRDPVFPQLENLPRRSPHIRRVFLLGRDRAIVPHGHRNMVSGHLVIHGSLRVRHFERVRDEPEHLLLRPTIDRESHPGLATTVSDYKDNVHWLVATSDVAATFDVIVPGLDPTKPTQFMDFVDPRRGERLGDGTIRAPRLSADEVFKRYGKTGA
ncbi:MAG: hypothetical protein ACREBC_07775 [Pyrinomonadaceae bacterium]